MALGHRSLSIWYDLLAQRLDAGQPLATALREAGAGGPPPRRAEEMAAVIEAGGSIDDALQVKRTGLPAEDLLFLSAAAEVGALPRILRLLSTRHHQRQAHRTRLLLTCMYPLFVLHVAALAFPLLQQVSWESGFQFQTGSYLRGVAQILVPVWIAFTTLGFLATRGGVTGFRLSQLMPIWGAYLRILALSDLAFFLGTLLEAGVRIDRAWQVAGVLSPAPHLRRASFSVATTATEGGNPANAVRSQRCFPATFIARYQSGQTTGHLPEALLRVAADLGDEALVRLKRASAIYPMLFLLLVLAWCAVKVITFFSAYLSNLLTLSSS